MRDPLSYRASILEHLVRMARQPGAAAYAWHAAKAYEQIDPRELRGIQAELKQRMTQEKETQQ